MALRTTRWKRYRKKEIPSGDRKNRPAIKVVQWGLVFFAVLMGWTVWNQTARFDHRIYKSDELDAVPERPIAIVFGAGYWADGALSDILRDRLDAVIELYRSGRVEKLLFSGDNRVIEYNEPAKMREYALSQGVPDDVIVLDYAGRRTYDTCYRARDIFQVTDVILVTQRYHLPRALLTCDGLDVDAVGYVADRTPYVHVRWYWLREIPAMWKAWWDVSIGHPTPVLGEPLPIFP
ncbi:MAG: YdcF family protein [Anaerolineales bacterium]|nr:YdcF family protein [Anaerolineales bacterium]